MFVNRLFYKKNCTIFMKNIRKNVKKLVTPFFFSKKFLKVLYKPMALKEFMLKYNLLSNNPQFASNNKHIQSV